MEKSKVIVICGPTASGKTSLSIELAKKINGEIVSCDSMQIYKDMDIGSAKPTVEEMQGIKHYLLDYVSPEERYSVSDYKEDASKAIEDIIAKGKVPIVVGGTGLYLNSLIYNIQYNDMNVDLDYRNMLEKEAEENVKEKYEVSTIDTHANKDYQELEKLEEEYKGYKIDSRLEIPKINLETYVLDSEEDEAMWLCPTVYFGPEPNETGNYCIAAHNYDKENMFNHIIELEIGDKIYLTDNENRKLEYEVYDIYKTEPDNTSPLIQDTKSPEITLITCSDYSSKRIIVKARKV